ncbi:MAG: hypothetical protein Q4E67_07370 [Planctomycetia bacterium]|nr:hypothetical protein [Planctomycetia bacterium]MDO5114181.1 hypothetical protein [Planctomycetia bacterium]
MWETILVALIVLVAFFFTAKSLAGTLAGKKCHCSEGNCPYAKKCESAPCHHDEFN